MFHYLHDGSRCGCKSCQIELGKLEQKLDARNGYINSINNPPISNYYAKAIGVDYSKKEMLKVEEPKNIAVKILVDKLNAEQISLDRNLAQLNIHENTVKTFRETTVKNLKNIKELAAALKKLGYKKEIK